MAEKINHGKSKMISSYGGVGSIIDAPDASIIIETFDNWGYPNYYDQELNKYIILDDRLVNRLRTRFPKLKRLVSIPVGKDKNEKEDVQPYANYFPKWFYCPRCHRFMHITDWKKSWGTGRQEFDLQCFNSDCKGEHLEQVRFVLTCDDGHIHDLPWIFWNSRKVIDNPESEEEVESNIQIDFEDGTCCENPDLRYIISQENTDLSGIHIKCNNCKKSATLKGIFNYGQKCGGLKYWNGYKDGQPSKEECNQRMSVKIKTSNSVYYANTLSSLWIPEKQILQLTTEIRTDIDEIINQEDFEQKELERYAKRKNIDMELINQYLEGAEIIYIPDIVYRKAEYEYFLTKQQPENKMIKFRQINVKDTLIGFEKLVKIDRLKKITVQTSFTRNQPIDTDSILINDNGYEYSVKRQSVSKNSFGTRLLPAIENYGEGILFVLDKQKLKEWESNEVVKQRIEKIKNNAADSDWQIHKIKAKTLTAKEVLIHTLSHLLIRELEYVCGYPMSSLQERLYISENMNGFLISAYDGTDGYLGGLTKLCNDPDNPDNKLRSIIRNALQRAKDCSLDPICYESDGQGIAQLNLAACHSCTLIPDTSCEMSNLFLDRRLVVDTKFGYFADLPI
ncbi:MAG: DUF1998 domain-containing protein [Desulfuromonadales bacterium]|nr:DUF1998 domain-containing protein [Desulfuromonadales bacterium]